MDEICHTGVGQGSDPDLTPAVTRNAAFAFDLLFSFRGGRNRRNVSEAGRVGLRRGVSRMDAAIELTGTYLQRPLRSPARPARPINYPGLPATNPTPATRGRAVGWKSM